MISRIAILLIGFVGYKVSCHGKEGPVAPHLPPNVFNSLISTISPKASQITAQWSCMPGYELRDDMCYKILIEDPIIACAGRPAINGTCQVSIEPITSCTVGGYELENDECVKIQEVGFQFYCPVGYYDDGQYCAKTMEAEMNLKCAIGELIGDVCILHERRAHLISSMCPEGSELADDGFCWKEVETFDCSEEQEQGSVTVLTGPQKSHTHVGKKVVVSKGKEGTTFRGLIGKEPLPIHRPPPPKPPKFIPAGKEMVAVTAPQQTAVEVVTKICKKKIQVDALALLSCPPDFVDEGNHCIKEIITTPLNICANGDNRNGTCQPAIHRVPKKPGCPKNSYFAREKCWMQDKISPDLTCPTGYVMEIDSGTCVGVVEAELECPVGFDLILGECITEIVRPALLIKNSPHIEAHSKKY